MGSGQIVSFTLSGSCHSLIVLSALPLTRSSPSGVMATDFTPASCPSKVARHSSVFKFHSLIVLSSLPLASNCPLGDMATQLIDAECPVRLYISPSPITRLVGENELYLPIACKSQTFRVVSRPPLTSVCPSGLMHKV